MGTPRRKRAGPARFGYEDEELRRGLSPCQTPIGGWDTEGLFVLVSV